MLAAKDPEPGSFVAVPRLSPGGDARIGKGLLYNNGDLHLGT